MINITLKDGSSKQYPKGITVKEVAESISAGLARVALAAEVDGEVKDLSTVLDKDCSLNLLTFDTEGGKQAFRHTASHILAQAVKRLYPNAKLAIGPAIENGFYYDFDVEKPFTPEDMGRIEEEMGKIIKEDIPLERFTLPRDEAIRYMEEMSEPYKVELIQDLPEDSVISFYRQGISSICVQGACPSTGRIKALMPTQAAGAYWRGMRRTKCCRGYMERRSQRRAT